MARRPAIERKVILVKEQRVPLKTLLNGKDFRVGVAALEAWRTRFNEDEILYGRRLVFEVGDWHSDIKVKVVRDETDAEYIKRTDQALKAKLSRIENARKRAELKQKQKEDQEAMVDKIKSMTVAEYLAQSSLEEDDLLRHVKNI